MKIIIINSLALLFCLTLNAQDGLRDQPRMFFSSGFVTPQFYAGNELLRANDLRQSGVSYFQDENGQRQAIGNAARNTGFSLSIGYYLPIQKVKGLSVGFLVNSGQTGSTPSEAGYAEGYFFNFLNFGAGIQYFPFENNNLYVEGELGMGSVFTKNRFIGENGQQDFLHHFGIGLEAGGGIGYYFTPFKTKQVGLFLEGQYQFYSTRVEVSQLGDDQWQFGALHLSGGLFF